MITICILLMLDKMQEPQTQSFVAGSSLLVRKDIFVMLHNLIGNEFMFANVRGGLLWSRGPEPPMKRKKEKLEVIVFSLIYRFYYNVIFILCF